MFTSCCPGWIPVCQDPVSTFPETDLYGQVAAADVGAVMKTYFAQKLGVEPEKIYTVSVMPCVAKKGRA